MKEKDIMRESVSHRLLVYLVYRKKIAYRKTAKAPFFPKNSRLRPNVNLYFKDLVYGFDIPSTLITVRSHLEHAKVNGYSLRRRQHTSFVQVSL